MARGSCTETIDHLTVALDEQYIGNPTFDSLQQLCENVFRLLNGFIAYLDRSNKNKSKP